MNHKIPLARLRPGQSARVAALPAGRDLNKLLAFGLLPGTEVTVLQVFPAYVLALGHTRVAIDREIASSIVVSR